MATVHPDMQVLIDAGKAAGEDSSDGMAVHDGLIPTADNQLAVRAYHPAGANGPRPCVTYVHGSGFLVGDLSSSDSIAWGYAQGTGAVVISPNYRKTPEHSYPAAFNDIYGVLEYVAGHAGQFGINAGRIAMAETPTLTTAGTRKYSQLYLANDLDTVDLCARPVKATDYTNLPSAWVPSAEIDPIRDDGRVCAANLALAGNHVTYREARGMIHGFLRARFTGDAARAEFDAICGFLKHHLGD